MTKEFTALLRAFDTTSLDANADTRLWAALQASGVSLETEEGCKAAEALIEAEGLEVSPAVLTQFKYSSSRELERIKREEAIARRLEAIEEAEWRAQKSLDYMKDAARRGEPLGSFVKAFDPARQAIIEAAGTDKADRLKPQSWERIREELQRKPAAWESRFVLSPKTDRFPERRLTFPSGGLTFIAAPSGHGKTTMLLDLLADAAKDRPDLRHWFFSYEESAAVLHAKAFNAFYGEQVALIGASNLYAIEEYIKTGDPRFFQDLALGHGLQRFRDALDNFKGLVEAGTINIIQADEFSAETLGRYIDLLATDRPGLVMVDYAQLLYQEDRGRLDRREELKHICLSLKDYAVAHGLTVILAAQFNRQTAHASKLHMSNIADAADIERAASKVIGLWNGNKGSLLSKDEAGPAAQFDKAAGITRAHEGQDDGTMFLKILKERNGVSELWATYLFNGNTLCMGTLRDGKRYPDPGKHGLGEPRGGDEEKPAAGKAAKKPASQKNLVDD